MEIRSGILLAIALSSASVHGAQPETAPAEGDERVAAVEVSAIKNPELKPYRVMSAWLDAFDEHRQLALTATY